VQLRQRLTDDRPLPLPAGPPGGQGRLPFRIHHRCATAFGGHHPIHQGQPLKRIPCVVHLAREHRPQVVLDIRASQCRTPEQHRPALRDTTRGHLDQVLLHDDRTLHQESGHADRVRAVLLGGVEDRVDRLLDADVHHLVAVVRQDDVDQVLADVVHIALHGGEHDPALAAVVGLLQVRLQICHRGLHHLSGLKHERQLHLTGAEQLTDHLHPVQQNVVDDDQRRHPGGQGRIQIRLETVTLTVDDPPLEPLVQRQGGEFLRPAGPRRGGVHTLESLDEALHRVVPFAATVVDQVERDLPLLRGDLRDRQDLTGVHDRRGQPGLDALVQEHRVEYLPGRRVEAERDVGDTQGEVDSWVAGGYLPNRFDGLDPVPPSFLLPGGDRKGQGVDEDVRPGHPPPAGQVIDQSRGHAHLPVLGTRLPLLVDEKRHHRRTVFLHHGHQAGVPRVWAVAVLEVDRVDHTPTAKGLQPGLDHTRLGRVQHDRQRGGGSEPASQLAHVLGAIPAHVVHTQVQQMRTVPCLTAGDLDTRLPVPGEHGLTERLGSVGVGPLPHHQHARVLREGHLMVDRRGARLRPRLPRHRRPATQPLCQHPDVLRRAPATAADQCHAIVGDEPLQGVGHLVRRQWEVRTVGGEYRQARVRHHRHRNPRVLRKIAQVLAHLGRAGGAVQPDQVDAERLDRGQCGADLAAQQHRAGGLHRHVADDRDRSAQLGHRSLRADHRCLHLEQVLAGLDDQRVRSTGDQASGVLPVRVPQRGVRGVSEGGQLRARPDRAEDEARLLRRRIRVGGGAGQPGARLGQLPDTPLDAVFGEVREVSTKCVCFHTVCAHGQVCLMHAANSVRPSHVEDFVAALQSVEVVEGQVCRMQHRAHRPVGDEDPVGQRVEHRDHHGFRLLRLHGVWSTPGCRSHMPLSSTRCPFTARITVLLIDRSARPTVRFPSLARRLTDVRDYSDATMHGWPAERAATRHRSHERGEVTA